MPTPSTKRLRRTPEEARRVILDAAEAVLARVGPSGLRLQEVAQAAGVSHPTILHHFESREGLIRALNQRTIEELRAAMRAQIETGGGSGGPVHAAFAAYRGGFAQRMVWMLLSGAIAGQGGDGQKLYDESAEGLHERRCSVSPPDQQPSRADSDAIIHLITIAALGDALVGARLRRAPDETSEVAAREAFENWLSALINRHIAPG